MLLSVDDNLYKRVINLIKNGLAFKNISDFVREAIENEVVRNEIAINGNFSFRSSPARGLWKDVKKNSVNLARELRNRK